MRMRRNLAWGGFATLPALAAASIALATTGNSIHVHAPTSVTSGHAFTVRLSGAAKGGGTVQVYLDRRKCASTGDKEGRQVGAYKNGKSYFIVVGEGTSKETWTGFYVAPSTHNAQAARQFKKSLRGHAGSRTGHEHACAYVFPGYGKPARAKTGYVVK